MASADATSSGGRRGFGEIILISPFPGEDVMKQLRILQGYKWHQVTKSWTFDPNASTARAILRLFPEIETNTIFDRLAEMGKAK